MNKNVNNNALFKKAEESIIMAKQAMKEKEIFLAWVVCYHSQQAVEQFLRVFLASHGVSAKNGSLIGLNHKCASVIPGFKIFDTACDFLAFGGLDIRYPTHSTLLKSDAKKAIKAAEQIKQFVLEKLQ